jgi:DNA-binding CsgD family transcriptional regulator
MVRRLVDKSAEHFAAQLVERAQSAPDLATLRREILEQLGDLIGFETVYWGEAPGEPIDSAGVTASRHENACRILSHFSADRRRYEVPHAIQAIYEHDGVMTDAEVFTAAERDRLPLFAEVLRPAGIRTHVACSIDFRGHPLSVVTLSRHGRGAPFSERDKNVLRAVKGAIGLVEAAFRWSARPEPAREDRVRAAYRLSAREAQVAVLITRGLQNKEIAALLGTSVDTVRKQTICTYKKVGVASRVQLVAKLAGRTRPT